MAQPDFLQPLWNLLGGGAGIGIVAAILTFVRERRKDKGDHALGVKAAEVSDEATALGGYDKLAGSLLLNQENLIARVERLEAARAADAETIRLQQRQLTFRDIYVAHLRTLVPPPPPEPPAGYEV